MDKADSKCFGSRFPGALKEKYTLSEQRRYDVRHPFYLRMESTDIPTFEQIFGQCQLSFDFPSEPRVIIDAGANIGISTIYFANRFPNAKVIAIEPEESNFELLKINCENYPNVKLVRAAVWCRNAKELTIRSATP